VWSPPRFMLIGWDLGTVLWKNQLQLGAIHPEFSTVPPDFSEHYHSPQKKRLGMSIETAPRNSTTSRRPQSTLRIEQVQAYHNTVPLPMLLSHGFRTDWAAATYHQTSSALTRSLFSCCSHFGA
jgi:hypothetical protein